MLSSFLQSQGGRLGIIQCSVESDPESNLTLRRGDDAIACTQGCPQATSPRVLVTKSYNSLKVEIRDVVVEDEGIYVCQAGNSQGSASATVDFKADSEWGQGTGDRVMASGNVLREGSMGRECWGRR